MLKTASQCLESQKMERSAARTKALVLLSRGLRFARCRRFTSSTTSAALCFSRFVISLISMGDYTTNTSLDNEFLAEGLLADCG